MNTRIASISYFMIHEDIRIGELEAEIKNYRSQLRYWESYTDYWGEQGSISRCWKWLKDPELNMEYTLEILNKRKSFPFKMKEYIIKRRPDLIGKIKKLPRKLRRKYKNELELSSIDI